MNTAQIYRVKRFGIKQEPITIIDDFSSHSAELVDLAKQANFQKTSKHYPGFRSPANHGYLLENFELLTRVFENVYELDHVMSVQESHYALMTTHPKYLSYVQCYPQFNSLESNSISSVHFFCDHEQGDLAFYRHRATGFEFIDEERLKIYGQVRSTDYKQLGAIQGKYMHESNKQFDLIGKIPAKKNRLILFRSYNLHMELPGSGTILLNDRNNGRLSINSIFSEKKPMSLNINLPSEHDENHANNKNNEVKGSDKNNKQTSVKQTFLL